MLLLAYSMIQPQFCIMVQDINEVRTLTELLSWHRDEDYDHLLEFLEACSVLVNCNVAGANY